MPVGRGSRRAVTSFSDEFQFPLRFAIAIHSAIADHGRRVGLFNAVVEAKGGREHSAEPVRSTGRARLPPSRDLFRVRSDLSSPGDGTPEPALRVRKGHGSAGASPYRFTMASPCRVGIGLVAVHRSTSPNTMSTLPRITTTSAIVWPRHMSSKIVRLIRLGGRTR